MNTQIVPTPTIEKSADGTLFVSSLTIAEGAGVEHRAVLQLVNNNIDDLEQFGRVAFEMRPLVTAGGTQAQRIAYLNEQQSTLVMTYQRNTEQVKAFKLALVKAFFEMAKQLAAPSLDLNAIDPRTLALAILEESDRADAAEKALAAVESKVEADAPKVAYVEQFVARDDRITFRALAGNLNLPESDLRKLLIDKHWIYRETEQRWSDTDQKLKERNRYSAYADKKAYFQNVLSHDAPRFKGGDVMHTLKITPAGAEAIARLVAKENAA